MTHRRSTVQRGYVNFPVDNPAYENTQEGGMFVRLVVWYDPDNGDDWMVCCGGYQDYEYDEELIGGHKEEDTHFPDLNGPSLPSERTYRSIPYLCVMTIGSTGWSGRHKEKEEYFQATYDDLTKDGKKLYDNVKKLYGPTCSIALQTWLDT